MGDRNVSYVVIVQRPRNPLPSKCLIAAKGSDYLSLMTTLQRIYRYPVKGLSPEPLDEIEVAPETGLPFDRVYAIAHASTEFDPLAPKVLPKTCFLQLMQNEKLATLETRFDPAEQTLTIRRQGRQVAKGNLSLPVGRSLIEQFLAAYMPEDLRGAPHVVTAAGHSFSDCGRKWLSIISLASVRDIERVARREVDPLRFRGNLYIDGLEPWAEFDWLDREIVVGEVRLKVLKRIDRCGATNVDPATGARDMQIPKTLQGGFGHVDCGLYAEIVGGGTLRAGDTLTAG